MAIVVDVEREVRNYLAKTCSHSGVEVRIAASAKGEIDGPIERVENLEVGLEGIERRHEASDPLEA